MGFVAHFSHETTEILLHNQWDEIISSLLVGSDVPKGGQDTGRNGYQCHREKGFEETGTPDQQKDPGDHARQEDTYGTFG